MTLNELLDHIEGVVTEAQDKGVKPRALGILITYLNQEGEIQVLRPTLLNLAWKKFGDHQSYYIHMVGVRNTK